MRMRNWPRELEARGASWFRQVATPVTSGACSSATAATSGPPALFAPACKPSASGAAASERALPQLLPAHIGPACTRQVALYTFTLRLRVHEVLTRPGLVKLGMRRSWHDRPPSVCRPAAFAVGGSPGSSLVTQPPKAGGR